MQPPITLKISTKPVIFVGEGAIIEIEHTVHAQLTLERVEMNRDRTRIFLSRLVQGTREEHVLTGMSHVEWHRIPLLKGLGHSFDAPAGSEWKSSLDLLLFAPSLARGSYTVSIEYRYGSTEAETTRSNEVEFEVVPIAFGSVRFRWFGERLPRGELAALWTGIEADAQHWFFQTGAPAQPEILRRSVSLSPVTWVPIEAPRLCQLNDIHSFHFLRHAMWLSPDGLTWVPVHYAGRQGEPSSFDPGLRDAILVDPPLQLRSDELAAVVVGRDPSGKNAVALIQIDAGGNPSQRVFPQPHLAPEHSAVAWGETEEPLSGRLFQLEPSPRGARLHELELSSGTHRPLGEVTGRVDGMVVEQWMGSGALLILCWTGTSHALWRYQFGSEEPGLQWRAWGPAGATLPHTPPLQIAAFPDGLEIAALFRAEDAWVVATSAGVWKAPLAESFGSVPCLVINAKGKVFFVVWHPERGFVAQDTTTRVASDPS